MSESEPPCSEEKCDDCIDMLCVVIMFPVFIISIPFVTCYLVCTLLLKLKEWTHDLKQIDVIFIPKGEKNNNDTKLENDKECCPKNDSEENDNQTKEETKVDLETRESRSDAVVLQVEPQSNGPECRDAAVELDTEKLNVIKIPQSLLKGIQEPPPLRCKMPCVCGGHLSTFYVVAIEQDSPLLPSDAQMSDAEHIKCLLAHGKTMYVTDKSLAKNFFKTSENF